MLRVRRLGRVSYKEALVLQRALAGQSVDDYLLLLEHPNVYTLGVRADPAHVLIDPSVVGAELIHTDRGGDVTFHGPGQLVVYPIITLDDRPDAGPAHVHQVEEVVLGALEDLGVAAELEADRLEGYPGVWFGVGGPRPRKLAAVGVRAIRDHRGRRRSLHGVAINVECELSMFGHIVPCGLADRPITSLRAEGIDVTMDQVADAVVARAAAMWAKGCTLDRQDVKSGPVDRRSELSSSGPGVPVALGRERPLLTRLRQAGVDPEDGLAFSQRKPPWLRTRARMGPEFLDLGRTIHDLDLVTVCEEAGCPNIFECWSDGTATFMVNGSRCTRACGFCKVDTRHPLPVDQEEPERVAQAVARMELAHAVVTCVARDDLSDGGAGGIAATVEAIRRVRPSTTVEVLISDCKGDEDSLATIFATRPDVLNHNVETVARLQRAVRPSAGYARSLAVLARAASEGLVVKSGLMVGLGETEDEVVATLADLRGVGVSIGTVGQYLRPSRRHLPVARWWTPQELNRIAERGRELGLLHVEASPLTRSSYHARQGAQAAGVSAAAIQSA